tara:strand:+ start:34 stop:672 length:639 start_codon:yes stop_codon:yes gene_type:complete
MSYNECCNYINVSRETYEKFLIYNDILLNWQNRMNLISSASIPNSFKRHFIDSAQIFSFFNNCKGNIIDFGSGAGFPGLVLAIMGLKNVHLVESKLKKCNFLKEVSMQTNTSTKIHNCRIENLPDLNPSYIISRGLAPTKKLIEICVNYIKNTQKITTKEKATLKLPNLLFLKGKNYKKELYNLSEFYNITFEVKQSITEEGGKILFYKSNK